MAIIVEQRAQLFQNLGNIATTAANSAAEGIAEAAKTDSKTVDTALKLFGGFDRNEFENIAGTPVPDDGMPNLLVPAVRPPASYEGPVEYFKPLSNTVEGQSLLVPAKDLLQQLEDPQFRMADGLSGFSANRITHSLAQKGMILNSKPGGDVSLGGLNENGIIKIDNKPANPADTVASLGFFGKLYRMENTVAKQLQLHEQLDLSTFGNFSGAKQNPRLDRGLKGMPDAQAAAPQSKKMLDLTLDHALNGTPQTVGEMLQMTYVLQEQIRKIHQMAETFGYGEQLMAIHERLDSVKQACKLLPSHFPPNQMMFDAFEGARAELQQFEYFTMRAPSDY